ncbi:MAG: hypothetical protein FJ146_01415 [Deltaproteobacteria bacterium]|nr:hypothetical protein [Deltaproteobacteria bacterium]
MVSRRPEQVGPRDDAKVYELVMPIDAYWAAEKQIKDLDYKRSSFEDQSSIMQAQREVLMSLVNFIVAEKDRLQVKAALNGPAGK